MCNQLVVIITYPEVIKSINRVGPEIRRPVMSLSWENRDIFADQEDMTADMTNLTHFTCMALKFNTPPQKKFGSLLSE